MQIKDFLRPENIFVGLSAASKQQLIEKLSRIAGEKAAIPEARVSKALFDREHLGSTGIGGGVAIPHTALPELEAPICLVATLSKPIDFEAVDDVAVDVVVLLLTPASATNAALNILSCIARRFREAGVVSRVRAARSADEAYILLAANSS